MAIEIHQPHSDIKLTLMGYTKDRWGSGIWYGSDGNFYKTTSHYGEIEDWRSWYLIPKTEVPQYIERLKK